jgi:hypothetical protein
MGSRYFFIVAYVWLEKYFSCGDYRKSMAETTAANEQSCGQESYASPQRHP